MTKPRFQVSETGLQLLMSFEGYRRTAARLADGRWTIGYGHTKSARRGFSVSEADARDLLIYDLMEISKALNALIFTPLTQNQFDALACFAFNIGLDNFRRSEVLRRVNEGDLLEAAYALEPWRKAEVDGEAIVVDGLVRRRAAEKLLFLSPPQGWSVVPTPVVQPRLDHDHQGREPTSHPVDVRADLTGELAKAQRINHPEPLIVLRATVEPSVAPDAEAEPVFPPDNDVLKPFPSGFQSIGEPHAAPVGPVDEAPENPEPWIFEPVKAEIPEAAAGPSAPEPTPVRAPLRARFGDFEFATVEAEASNYGPWVALGVVGLVIFATSIFWALSAHGPSGPFGPQVLGSLAALVGVACVVCAVYSLIQRYLGRDD